MKNTPEIRSWLKDQLRLRNWSHADLARETGKPQSTWKRLIDGETKELRSSSIESLCSVFGVTENQLFAISHNKIFERAAIESAKIKEPDGKYKTQWDSMAEWLELQPKPVKTAMSAVAESHGWKR